MSTENLNNENVKDQVNSKSINNVSKKKIFNQTISNSELNKINKYTLNKKKTKTCINKLQNRLRKTEEKKKYESRILYCLFISAIAVLFYAST